MRALILSLHISCIIMHTTAHAITVTDLTPKSVVFESRSEVLDQTKYFEVPVSNADYEAWVNSQPEYNRALILECEAKKQSDCWEFSQELLEVEL